MIGHAAARRAIDKRLEDQWSSTTPIRWDNTPWTEPVGRPWIWPMILGSSSEQASLESDPLFRDFRILQISLFVPRGSGTGGALDLCEQLAAIFRRWATVLDGDEHLVFYSPAIERGMEEREWLGYHVDTRFRLDRRYG